MSAMGLCGGVFTVCVSPNRRTNSVLCEGTETIRIRHYYRLVESYLSRAYGNPILVNEAEIKFNELRSPAAGNENVRPLPVPLRLFRSTIRFFLLFLSLVEIDDFERTDARTTCRHHWSVLEFTLESHWKRHENRDISG